MHARQVNRYCDMQAKDPVAVVEHFTLALQTKLTA